MKKSLRFLSLILIVMSPLSGVFSQQKPIISTGASSRVSTLEPDIAAIRAEYVRINMFSLKQTAFKFESPNCVQGGLITYFKDNGAILKITNSGSIGDGSWTTDFYYKSGKLIFCYDKLVGGPAAEKEVTVEYRLYVKNDKAIRCLEGKKVVQPDSKARSMMRTAYGLLKADKTKNFSAALCDE